MSALASETATPSGNELLEDPRWMYFIVDASIWVSRLVSKDVFHDTVKAWMEEQRAQGAIFLSPALLLPEVAGAISRRTGEKQIANEAIDRLAHLPRLRLIEMDQPILLEAAHLAANLGLRGADSIYVALARRLNLPLVTLDKDQSTRAASVISVYYLEEQG